MHEERCKKAQEEANGRIKVVEEECARIINERRVETQSLIDSYIQNAEEERLKYLSIIETIANAQAEEERDLNRHIKVREAA